jgi:cyclophilin family peptidyl-prolyl cis-trans isomerase
MGTDKRARQKANRQARLEQALAAQTKAKKKRQWIKIGAAAVLVVGFLAAFALTGRNNGDTKVSTDSVPASTTATSAPPGSTPGSSTASSTTGSSDSASTASTTASSSPGATAAGAAFTYGSGECPPANGDQTKKTFDAAPKECIDPAKAYTATFETTAGTVKVQLDTKRTPGTTNNFVSLARWNYYDGTKLFRTDPSIGIIQGGGQTNTDTPGYTIPDEGGKFTYQPGDLVMARTGAPNSGGGQFFFAVDDNVSNLDSQGTYVTFGHVTEGMDVLQKVLASNKPQPNSQLGGAPDPPVTVNNVTIAES